MKNIEVVKVVCTEQTTWYITKSGDAYPFSPYASEERMNEVIGLLQSDDGYLSAPEIDDDEKDLPARTYGVVCNKVVALDE